MLARTLVQTPRRAVLPVASNAFSLRPAARFYAESTRPHTPPSPEPFFSRKRMSLEITPLFALIGTIVIVATGAIVRNLVSDPDIHSRHGVEVDDKLKKVLAMPKDEAGEKKKADEKN
ncbi:hypothetical protein JCM3766R1_002061 [Sporobolomyces carnicolor]